MKKKEVSSLQAIAYLCNERADFKRRSLTDKINFLYGIGLSESEALTVLEYSNRLNDAVHGLLDGTVSLNFCPLGWKPNAYAPVFYGYEDISHIPEMMAFTLNPDLLSSTIQPPPVDLRIFFPSVDGSPQHAELLNDCGKYPLVIFIHGQCETNAGLHYLQWYHLPMQLARCGYVVVVPRFGLTNPFNDSDLDKSISVVNWMRTQWRHRYQLAPESQTAIIGHSYGAIVGGRLASKIACSAFISLSGEWIETVGGALPTPHPLSTLSVPAFFMWGTGDDTDANLEGAGASLFNAVNAYKYSLSFRDANHFDYLPLGTQAACGGSPGPCNYIGLVAAAFASLFLCKFLPTGAPVAVGDELRFINPPALSEQQHFFQGGHLIGLSFLASSDECQATLKWFGLNGETGTRNIPS